MKNDNRKNYHQGKKPGLNVKNIFFEKLKRAIIMPSMHHFNSNHLCFFSRAFRFFSLTTWRRI